MNDAWSAVALGDAGTWVSGGTPTTSTASYWGGSIPWMSSKSLTNFKVRDSDRKLTLLGAESGTRLVPPNTILMVVRGMSLKSEFRMGITERTVALSQDLKGLLPRSEFNPLFLAYAIKSKAPDVLEMVDEAGHGTGRLQTDRLFSLDLPFPPMCEQLGIAATLGALDDKIESNRRACRLLRDLGLTLVAQVGRSRAVPLRDLTLSIARGVTPQYAGDDRNALVVINQKCVRDGRVSLAPARRMVERQVAPEKRVTGGDVLVNSTGTGTLGRVGRWHVGEVFADSHVSIVKADPARIGPTLLAYLMFPREADVEEMATGSTGQTELSPARLGDLVIEVPQEEDGRSLEPILMSFESRAAALDAETVTVAQLRDTLLPELLSGRIRVPEAREAVEEATG